MVGEKPQDDAAIECERGGAGKAGGEVRATDASVRHADPETRAGAGAGAAAPTPIVPDSDEDVISAVFGISTPTTAASPPCAAHRNTTHFTNGNGSAACATTAAVEELMRERPIPKPRSREELAGEAAAQASRAAQVDEDVLALDEPSSPLASPPRGVATKAPARSLTGSPTGAQPAASASPSPTGSPGRVKLHAVSASGSRAPSAPSAAALHHRREDVSQPVQIRSDSIAGEPTPPSRADSVADTNRSRKKEKPPPTELPRELLMPLAQRCDFCIKFDSVCSMCHFKWRGLLKQRQATMLAHFKVLPEAKRVGILFATVARGPIDFTRAILEANPHAVGWYVRFQPLESEVAALPGKFADSGRLFPLHVAFAYKRCDVAEVLMNAGATVRRSENRVLPTEYLLSETSRSLPDDWEAMLDKQQSYVEHCMAERARSLRNGRHFDDAQLEYDALLQVNPRNEHALCGLAKMKFDQGQLRECIAACEALLRDPSAVNWVEFAPETVASLQTRAVAEFHARAHAVDGPAWVRECGCIVTERTVIALRRLPLRLIREHVLPFADGHSLYMLWKAVRVPVLQRAAEAVAAAACDPSVGRMLANEFGYAEMYESIRTDLPTSASAAAIVAPPMQFVGLQVVAMGDFHTFIIRASVVGANPKWRKRFFESDELPKRVVVTKQFRVHRADLGKAWDVHEAGEWEVDDAATASLTSSGKR